MVSDQNRFARLHEWEEQFRRRGLADFVNNRHVEIAQFVSGQYAVGAGDTHHVATIHVGIQIILHVAGKELFVMEAFSEFSEGVFPVPLYLLMLPRFAAVFLTDGADAFLKRRFFRSGTVLLRQRGKLTPLFV